MREERMHEQKIVPVGWWEGGVNHKMTKVQICLGPLTG